MSGEPTRCLHLVAGSARRCLQQAVAHAAPGDSLLFLDAGVLHLLRAAGEETGPENVDSWFLRADLEAQGLAGVAARAGVPVADDAAFVELLAAHRLCLSWT